MSSIRPVSQRQWAPLPYWRAWASSRSGVSFIGSTLSDSNTVSRARSAGSCCCNWAKTAEITGHTLLQVVNTKLATTMRPAMKSFDSCPRLRCWSVNTTSAIFTRVLPTPPTAAGVWFSWARSSSGRQSAAPVPSIARIMSRLFMGVISGQSIAADVQAEEGR